MAPQLFPVTIEFTKQDTVPPIFLAGTFSEPAWKPLEMEFEVRSSVYHYHKEVHVESGKEYQYKFRIGEGDWWMLNEAHATATDGAGNRNNLLKVSPEDNHAASSSPSKASGGTAEEPTKVTDSSRQISNPKSNSNPTPTLVVEKTDSKPSYGDDFGKDATVAQKDAHALRAGDAEPDVKITDGQRTPDIADEVADSAQALDREAPTPPIPDEEAGRIGFRRMSSTPIPEVAETAAEVADTAARLDADAEGPSHIDMPPLPTLGISTPGATTPWEERAPLFAHEILSPPSDEAESPPAVPAVPKVHIPDRKELVDDFDDPSIEEFPHDRRLIMEQVRAMEARLQEDEAHFEGVPPSPVVGADRSLNSHALPSPSPALLAREASPSLKPIPEEHSRFTPPLLPSALTSSSSQNNKPSSKVDSNEGDRSC